MTIDSLADIPHFAARPRAREIPARRIVAWVLVLIVHALMLSIFFLSQRLPPSFRTRGAVETMLDLRGVTNANAPEPVLVQPKAPVGAPPIVIPEPITVPPPPMPQGAAPSTPGDILGAVGQELACGAENFENLNQAQRNRCRHIPWAGAKLPSGNIVMLPPPQRLVPTTAPPQIRLSGQDAQRRQAETSSSCPVMLNIPCLNKLPDNN